MSWLKFNNGSCLHSRGCHVDVPELAFFFFWSSCDIKKIYTRLNLYVTCDMCKRISRLYLFYKLDLFTNKWIKVKSCERIGKFRNHSTPEIFFFLFVFSNCRFKFVSKKQRKCVSRRKTRKYHDQKEIIDSSRNVVYIRLNKITGQKKSVPEALVTNRMKGIQMIQIKLILYRCTLYIRPWGMKYI